MGKKATKAADNVFCIARYEASEKNEVYSSRESAAEAIGIDRTRLARIELGNIVPYPEEVLLLSNAYHSPELCNQYCAHQCPIGKKTVKELDIQEFDRVALRVLGSLKNIDSLRARLISIAEDGVVTEDEYEEFATVLDSLGKISENAQSLKLWAEKYIVDLQQYRKSE